MWLPFTTARGSQRCECLPPTNTVKSTISIHRDEAPELSRIVQCCASCYLDTVASKQRNETKPTELFPLPSPPCVRIRHVNKFVADVVQVAAQLRPLPDRPVEEVRETFATKLELSMKLAISKYKPIQVHYQCVADYDALYGSGTYGTLF